MSFLTTQFSSLIKHFRAKHPPASDLKLAHAKQPRPLHDHPCPRTMLNRPLCRAIVPASGLASVQDGHFN